MRRRLPLPPVGRRPSQSLRLLDGRPMAVKTHCRNRSQSMRRRIMLRRRQKPTGSFPPISPQTSGIGGPQSHVCPCRSRTLYEQHEEVSHSSRSRLGSRLGMPPRCSIRKRSQRRSPIHHERPSMISISSLDLKPCRRAKSNSSRARTMTAVRSGVPATVTPRPRRNSKSPSSRNRRKARKTVLELTCRTAAKSLAGGNRSPGDASPSAIARRISAATCSWSASGSVRSTLTREMMLFSIAPQIPHLLSVHIDPQYDAK